MIRTVFAALSALLLFAWTGISPAQDFFGDRKPVKKPRETVEKPAAAKKAPIKRQPVKRERTVKKPRRKKDPVAAAFALPKGMVLTKEEQAFAKQVRGKLEPQLRKALEKLEKTEDKTEKRKAAKQVQAIRAQIKTAVNMILQRRYAKAMREYAKQRAKKLEEMKKHAQKHGKRKGGRKKR